METDFPFLDETVVATARYLGAVVELSAEDLLAPSLLPGWTRAHVVTHLARNADAFTGLLHAAQAGEPGAMYPSVDARNADIEAGATRGPADLRADAVASAGRWVQAANELHASRLGSPVSRLPDGEPFPVSRVGLMRLTEVEVHHADLGIGYTAADWSAVFTTALHERRARELAEGGVVLSWSADDTGQTWSSGPGGPHVSGTAAALAWWLVGRSSGEGLACSEDRLPELGRWG